MKTPCGCTHKKASTKPHKTLRSVELLGYRADVEDEARIEFWAPAGGGSFAGAGKATLERGEVRGLRGIALPRDILARLIARIEGR
jgi:hypothetical protein